MAQSAVDGGSFRDPSGHVYEIDGRILRTIRRGAAPAYEALRDQGLLQALVSEGRLVPAQEVDPGLLGGLDPEAVHLVEHPRLPFISHPYEWPFPALKAAALFHLDLHLSLLEQGATLSDASAYNVQFDGPRPVFIDLLSLRPYREGEYWLGHKQFCEQFLNPLLLSALTGVAYHAWYRGALEGIPTEALARLLPPWRRLGWRVLTHVVLPARFQARAARPDAEARAVRAGHRPFPLAAYRGMLRQLRGWIAGLGPRSGDGTTWSDYEDSHGYDPAEFEAKRRFVAAFVERTRPALLWDLGCNTGVFAELALAEGAERVIGFDYDQGALDKAFARAVDKRLRFLPLYLDAANPSPDQGWRQGERRGLAGRRRPDALVALAFEHHLAIGRNVPLPELVAWLTGLADNGVVEFVEKSDPRIQRMLALREDIFQDYDKQAFESALAAHARIVGQETVSGGGRTMYAYTRSPS